MKKKILFGTVAAGIMLVSVIGAHRALSGGDKLLDANIEALTQGEETAKCEATLACDMLNPAYNKVSCTGFRECHRYPVERYVECDGMRSGGNG